MSHDQPNTHDESPQSASSPNGQTVQGNQTYSDQQSQPVQQTPQQEPHNSANPQHGQHHGQHNQQRRQASRNQDIRNAQWLTLSRDEEILWWGHPSLVPHIPVIAASLLAAVVGIASMFMFYDMVGYKGLIFVPLGLVGAAIDYIKIITTFYVVTSDKVVCKKGVIRRDTIEMRYENIEHVNARQTILERIIGFGDIDLATAGTGENEATLDNVRQPRQVTQTINQQKDNAYNQLAHKQLN